jgi:hypothetical protein
MYIERIQSATHRMQLLIQDILTLSKISIDRTPFVETDLNVLLRDLLIDMSSAIKVKNGKVITSDNLPTLSVNPVLIRSLFQNLISNSLKYSKTSEAPVIKITSEIGFNQDATRKDFKSKYCRIYFEDNGIGFDQKHADQIFTIFKRLHSSAEFEGTGIGLAICKKIAEQHGGYIFAKGKPNEGATFTLSLPYAAPVNPTRILHSAQPESTV